MKGTVILLTIMLQLYHNVSANSNCCNGKLGSEVEVMNDCTKCSSECDCSLENCDMCEGSKKCCQTCCEQRCDCRVLNCNSCGGSSCCENCCKSSRCRSSRCSSVRQCSQCNCDGCIAKDSTEIIRSSCCKSCCKDKEIIKEKISGDNSSINHISQMLTLPNITVIINQAPIYVNNTPVISADHKCGNASFVNNGTHVIYVYPPNSTCENRTCCMAPVRRRCRQMPPPLPPLCPPPLLVPDCSSRCLMGAAPGAAVAVAGAATAACHYVRAWPYLHCPLPPPPPPLPFPPPPAACYGLGYGCAPAMSMATMGMVASASTSAAHGCYRVGAWPFVRCAQPAPDAAAAAAFAESPYSAFPAE